MQRSSFIKALFTLIAAPSLLGDLKPIEPYKENEAPVKSDYGRIRFYTNDVGKYRRGDLIMSDMNFVALITTICNVGDKAYLEAAAVTGEYKYKDINEFRVFASAIGERGSQTSSMKFTSHAN